MCVGTTETETATRLLQPQQSMEMAKTASRTLLSLLSTCFGYSAIQTYFGRAYSRIFRSVVAVVVALCAHFR